MAGKTIIDVAKEAGVRAGEGNPPSDETLNAIRGAGVDAVHAYQRGVDSIRPVPEWEKEAAKAAANRGQESEGNKA